MPQLRQPSHFTPSPPSHVVVRRFPAPLPGPPPRLTTTEASHHPAQPLGRPLRCPCPSAERDRQGGQERLPRAVPGGTRAAPPHGPPDAALPSPPGRASRTAGRRGAGATAAAAAARGCHGNHTPTAEEAGTLPGATLPFQPISVEETGGGAGSAPAQWRAGVCGGSGRRAGVPCGDRAARARWWPCLPCPDAFSAHKGELGWGTGRSLRSWA